MKPLSATLLLTLCKAASMIAKGEPMKLNTQNKRSVKALEARKLVLVRDDNVVPSMEGFREVKGLAPVPLTVIREDATKEVASRLRDVYLTRTNQTTGHRFGMPKVGVDIRSLRDLRKAMERHCFADDLALFPDPDKVSMDLVVF